MQQDFEHRKKSHHKSLKHSIPDSNPRKEVMIDLRTMGSWMKILTYGFEEEDSGGDSALWV